MKKSSFTLAELIVAVSIIALLLALLSPVLRKSRQQAKTVLCSSNIKQLAYGFFAYDAERHSLPYGWSNSVHMAAPAGGYAGSSQFDRLGWWWFDFLEGFYKKSGSKESVLQCPSKWVNDDRIKNNILYSNYGANRSICKSSGDRLKYVDEFVGSPLSVNDIKNPGNTLLVADSGYSLICWWHAADSPPFTLGNTIAEDTSYIPGLKINKGRSLRNGQEEDAIYGRHPKKTVNVGFADFHLSPIKADDLLVEKTGDIYKNKIPLWVPIK